MNEESCIQESYESKLADILHVFEESRAAYHAAWQAEQHIEKKKSLKQRECRCMLLLMF